ncbi:MAG: sigma-70 family RNA polymerase sigma factor [Phycisphaerales bacterium]|nr:sigma-70 family RNA polymerase sigma factor [Phycisphaerales bacterium]
MNDEGDITRLIRAAASGDEASAATLFPLVYGELRKLAQAYMKGERAGHTLDATALVHEVYMRLVAHDSATWSDRTTFFGVAAQAMRRILIDHARKRRSAKRGRGVQPTPLDEALVAIEGKGVDVLELDEALSRLEAIDARKARLVELRFFAGLSVQDAASLLDVPLRSAQRDWTMARAWLLAELGP